MRNKILDHYDDYSTLQPWQRQNIVKHYRDQLYFTTPLHAAGIVAYNLSPAKSRDNTKADPSHGHTQSTSGITKTMERIFSVV